MNTQMSAAQHTPGPWAAWRMIGDRLGRWRVVCVNELHCPGTGKQVVASGIRGEPDARLIATAPELLAACEEALRNLVSDGHSHYRVADQLREVITKAIGNAT